MGWEGSGVTLTASADQVPGHLELGRRRVKSPGCPLKVVERGGMPGAGGWGAVSEQRAEGYGFAIWAGVSRRVLHGETGGERGHRLLILEDVLKMAFLLLKLGYWRKAWSRAIDLYLVAGRNFRHIGQSLKPSLRCWLAPTRCPSAQSFHEDMNSALQRIFLAGAAWKLWFLLPRLLLHRHPDTRILQKPARQARIAFEAGHWQLLLADARAPPPKPTNYTTPELNHCQPQAFTASALPPGTEATLQELQPLPAPYPAPAEASAPTDPHRPAPDLPAHQSLTNLRRARERAAPGPSGLTAEVLHHLVLGLG